MRKAPDRITPAGGVLYRHNILYLLLTYHLQLCCRVPRSCVDLRQSAGDRAPRHVQLHRDVNLRCLVHDIAPDDLRVLLTVTCLCYDLLPLALQQAGQVVRNPHPRADRHHLQSGWRGTLGFTAYDSEWECSPYSTHPDRAPLRCPEF